MNYLEIPFDPQKHVRYFGYCLRKLPTPYGKLDTNRLTLVHFCVHALDMLSVWESESAQKELAINKQNIIEWIYTLQVTSDDGSEGNAANVGFKGGTFLGPATSGEIGEYNHGHIAMTYTALATLRTLGDNLGRVDKEGIIRGLQCLQYVGSFSCVSFGSEHDMRFLYCACCISHMLDDWSGVDSSAACDYIRASRSFDGAFGLIPGQEGHGGSTFCAVASLVLMDKFEEVLDSDGRADMIRWCVSRQVGGMQGRPHKDEDTCYSYWIGATLKMLGMDRLLDHASLRTFVMKCQTNMGGFSKTISAYPDILHAYYSMAYLSLSQPHFNEDDVSVKNLNATLGICQERAELFRPVFP